MMEKLDEVEETADQCTETNNANIQCSKQKEHTGKHTFSMNGTVSRLFLYKYVKYLTPD